MKPIDRTLAARLASATPGSTVRLCGHVHRRRELAAVTFLVLRDRSGLAQVVVKPAEGQQVPPEETPVEVTGIATATPQAPGGVEVASPVVTALSEPALTPPVELWRPEPTVTLPALLDHAPVTWRHPAVRARWDLAAASVRGFRKTLDAAGFTEVHSPKIVESATESGANVFAIDYFGRPAYLAQSPQFYKQQLVGIFERVYEAGPVFRAEPHDTVRHLAEYVSLDVELGFIRDHRDVLAVLREVLAGMGRAIETYAADAVERLGVELPVVPPEIPVVHFADALELVGAPADEPDLAPEHERALGAWARETHGSDLLAVEGYPMRKRPFYTHPWSRQARSSEGGSNSFDLLFRGLELVTGGQRLHRLADYERAITERGEQPAAYASYLQAFAHGMPPHGGFALGLERWVARLVRAANVREVTLFPRDLHRLTP
ncbi:nondiscriminating aspartyl-tRNA synthetase [Nocardioides luteus]|uniref:Aspartate--tRNA(Asp/Asn) ligase n=1 Tax=Nocardioides luteus TaxID=1844 RepID=A0ABQ5SUN4_9ACTN|nr:aspartate--tRNA(Asn) ligase [Nocardioides luteus]MDR7309498.1 nondiscriminating aspartyl-tRNA synthetase [Nocardioides luteus]GGR51638.1 aspartate--tRNA(Asp/Asn) ligase [Nocardioides luteus]GLJ67903.1 aspartate--tRNA(Asp/Asn) ligase [Nocardioides luteus]